jgi:hypothetical protein
MNFNGRRSSWVRKLYDVHFSHNGAPNRRRTGESNRLERPCEIKKEKITGSPVCASCQEQIILERAIGRKENSVQSWHLTTSITGRARSSACASSASIQANLVFASAKNPDNVVAISITPFCRIRSALAPASWAIWTSGGSSPALVLRKY